MRAGAFLGSNQLPLRWRLLLLWLMLLLSDVQQWPYLEPSQKDAEAEERGGHLDAPPSLTSRWVRNEQPPNML
jgi:hypothetical protein